MRRVRLLASVVVNAVTDSPQEQKQLITDPAISNGHDGTLRALIISPTGEWVASGSDDFTIILWDTNGNIAH